MVIQVIKPNGKCGLSYRGKRNKAAHSLDDDDVDHGNFLKIFKILGKFDETSQKHLDQAIKACKKLLLSVEQASGGRGGLVNFLSKTTVNYIFEIIRQLMKDSISKEIRKARMFSIQITRRKISRSWTNAASSSFDMYVTDGAANMPGL